MAMRTVADIIKELQAFPPGSVCAAIERENCGIVVYELDQIGASGASKQIGYVETPLPGTQDEGQG